MRRLLFVVVLGISCCPLLWAETARDRPLSDIVWHRQYQDAKLAADHRPDLILEYRELMESAPTNASAHLLYGRALDPQKNFEDVHHHLRKAVELDPRLFWARYSLGSFYLASERLKPAEVQLREAAKLNPDHPQALLNLSTIYFVKREYAKCRRTLKHALEVRPDYPAAINLQERLERADRAPSKPFQNMMLAGIVLLIVVNFIILRKRYKKYSLDNDAFVFGRERSVRRKRHAPGTRRPVAEYDIRKAQVDGVRPTSKNRAAGSTRKPDRGG
jgi:tetratricopeptide (TPR) repeat protein